MAKYLGISLLFPFIKYNIVFDLSICSSRIGHSCCQLNLIGGDYSIYLFIIL